VREGTVVAEFIDPGEAQLARHTLAEAGIEAWLEGAGPVRLVVAPEAADEARDLIADLDFTESPRRRPVWVSLVAALVVAGLVWAAVPRFLWPWLLFGGLIGFLLWRAAGPRRP
jgi:hypothetical protein